MSLKKFQMIHNFYEREGSGRLIRTYGPNMDKIEKNTLSTFENNVRDLLDYMSANYTISIDKDGFHEDCVHHIFRDIVSG